MFNSLRLTFGTVLSLTVVMLSGCAVAKTSPRPAAAGEPGAAALEVAVLLSGTFSSAAQAAVDSAYFDIRLDVAPIWLDRTDGPWLYVEQAAAGSPPYRQRVYHVVGETADIVRSEILELPGDPTAFAGAHADESLLAGITPDDLARLEGCDVTLIRGSHDTWSGSTHENDCGTEWRGASYATSEVTVSPTLMKSWDRGFDANGTYLWGAEHGPYRFERID